jgi:rRNA-processing protein FCF1
VFILGYAIPDTNVLLNNPDTIKILTAKGHKVVIPITVLDELDKLKSRSDIGFKAREAIRRITRETEKKDGSLVLVSGEYAQDPLLDFKIYDRRIVACALFYKKTGQEVTIITSDAGMRAAARAYRINAIKSPEEIEPDNKHSSEITKVDTYMSMRHSEVNENRYFGNNACAANNNPILTDLDSLRKDLLIRIQEILGPHFKPKYNKTGVTFWGPKDKRILKLVNTRNTIVVEFNSPVTIVPDLIVLTDKEARDMKMGTCRWIYKGDNAALLLDLVKEALISY